jgi:putative transposase
MPRIARVVARDFPHHITQRGARNQRVFFSLKDKALYKEILLEEVSKTALQVWAYCLMDNHVHFVAVPKEENELSKVFREAHKRYAWTINRRKGWRGHLWQERFHSYVMDEKHLYAAVRYVENNPVKAGIVKYAEDYPWSSAYSRIYSKPDPLLKRCFLDQEIKNWKSYLREDSSKDDELIGKHINGNPLGSKQFINKLEQLLGKALTKKPRGRPPVKNK